MKTDKRQDASTSKPQKQPTDTSRWGNCPWHQIPRRDDGGCAACAAEFGDADAYKL